MLRAIVRNKWYPPADPTHLSFTGRTVLVTGSSSGLGLEAARKFAAQDVSRLILGVRDLQKGEKAKALIAPAARNPSCRIEVWALDMLDYGSILAFSKRCQDELERLDMAVLNAGVYSGQYRQSQYGWEHTLQVNTVSTTLLALLLLPVLRRSKTTDFTPVLEFVSSGRHRAAQFPQLTGNANEPRLLEYSSKEENFDGSRLYQESKLFLMCVLQELATREHHDLHTFTTSCCPGACASDLARDVNTIAMQAGRIAANWLFLRTAEQGARTLVSGTSLGQKGHGKFWQHDEIKDGEGALAGDRRDEIRRAVWKEVLGALGKDDVPDFDALMQRS